MISVATCLILCYNIIEVIDVSNEEKILSRIQKILAKTDTKSNRYEAEIQVALLKAQEILAKYNLSMSDVEEYNSLELDEIITDTLDSGAKLIYWKKMLASLIAKNFKCKSFTSKLMNIKTRKAHYSIKFIGRSSDIEVAKYLYNTSVGALENLVSDHLKALRIKVGSSLTPSIAQEARNSYILGFIIGLDQKFQLQVESKSLVVLPDAEVLKK